MDRAWPVGASDANGRRSIRSLLGSFAHSVAIGLMAFFTLVDLFATQAILPSLAKAYSVSPGEIGLAVSATTVGMAVASLGVALFSHAIDRRRGIIVSLTLLAIPTLLLAYAPNLMIFAGLRIAQGLCMASAFTLTLAYLGERYSAGGSARRRSRDKKELQRLHDRARIGRDRGLKMHRALVINHANRRLVDRHVLSAEEFHRRASALFDRRDNIGGFRWRGFRRIARTRTSLQWRLAPIAAGYRSLACARSAALAHKGARRFAITR